MNKYVQEFRASSRDLQLMELAREYHKACDAYDNRICSGYNSYGESMPRTSAEFQLVNQNAIEVRRRIINKGVSLGFDKHTVSKAISKYQ